MAEDYSVNDSYSIVVLGTPNLAIDIHQIQHPLFPIFFQLFMTHITSKGALLFVNTATTILRLTETLFLLKAGSIVK